jgi:DNA-binding NarL/FixJ family response regulator
MRNILLVDDHPMTVNGYQQSLSHTNLISSDVNFCKAYSCEEAFTKLHSTSKFELAIIDFGLPPFPDKEIATGSDLAKEIKRKDPQCKIIMITAHTEVLIVYNIFKNTNPDGLIIKNDLTPENLPSAVAEVLEGKQFHSLTAKKAIKEIWKKELMVNDTNREILMYLKRGYKIKDIHRATKISMSTIQRRLAQMNDAFNVSEETSLVREAYLQGYL